MTPKSAVVTGDAAATKGTAAAKEQLLVQLVARLALEFEEGDSDSLAEAAIEAGVEGELGGTDVAPIVTLPPGDAAPEPVCEAAPALVEEADVDGASAADLVDADDGDDDTGDDNEAPRLDPALALIEREKVWLAKTDTDDEPSGERLGEAEGDCDRVAELAVLALGVKVFEVDALASAERAADALALADRADVLVATDAADE